MAKKAQPHMDPDACVIDGSLTSVGERQAMFLSAIVNSAEDAIIGNSLDGTILTWNRAAERMFGYRPEEVIGRSIAILADPSKPNEMVEVLEQLRNGERFTGYETTRRRKDGVILPVSLAISPMRDGEGRLACASNIARDITGQKKREEEVRLLNGDLEHRLKNVYSLIVGILRLTKRTNVSEYREAIEERILALDRAYALLSVGSWQHARLDLLIARLIEGFSDRDDPFEIRGPPISVGSEATQALSMAINELGTNAVKYGALSRDGGTVQIGWRSSSDGLRMTWREKGGPRVKAPSVEGFGLGLLRACIQQQMGGALRMDWPASGVVCTIDLLAQHLCDERGREPSPLAEARAAGWRGSKR